MSVTKLSVEEWREAQARNRRTFLTDGNQSWLIRNLTLLLYLITNMSIIRVVRSLVTACY